MTQTYDIAIAGAGPAGLACALSLAERGWRVAVIDPAPRSALAAPSFDGREIALTHHSRDWLERNGVWDRIPAQCISPLKTAQIESGDELSSNGSGGAPLHGTFGLCRRAWLSRSEPSDPYGSA